MWFSLVVCLFNWYIRRPAAGARALLMYLLRNNGWHRLTNCLFFSFNQTWVVLTDG